MQKAPGPCTALNQEPPSPLQQNKGFKVAVTVIYIPEEKEKFFLVYRITQVAKQFPGQEKFLTLQYALIIPRAAVTDREINSFS